MATIKSYTNIEQSRKLAEILPLESADMYFEKGIGDSYKEAFGNYADRRIAEIMLGIKTIPCWSLAALLSVLPNNENIHTNLSKGGYRIPTHEYTNSWFADYKDETNGYNCVTSADNPVEWSEEDERVRIALFLFVEAYCAHANYEVTQEEMLSWLKSLRPQNRWKPSDEQIKVLSDLIAYKERWESSHSLNILRELLDDLKKLREK